ncbi:MAG: glycosyltransferase, partial [Alkalispirochaeta sp.]
TILALYDRISVFHTLSPWILGLHRAAWPEAQAEAMADTAAEAVQGVRGRVPDGPPRLTFTDDPEWCLRRDRNEYLVVVRRFLKPPITDLDLMARLRQRYRRIFFLNGNAGGGLHRPEVLPLVDRFYTKAVFTDLSLYQRHLYGGELFTHRNHHDHGVEDPNPVIPDAVAEHDLSKIHVHWNIGVGDFPRRKTLQRIGVALARMPGGGPRLSRPIIHREEMLNPLVPDWIAEDEYRYDVNARLGRPGYPTIAHHREVLTEVLDGAAHRHGWNVARDRVPARRYLADMKRSRITFSPFGWGEVCFRDFEAVRAGSLLIKPDMSHLRTWPDIFVPGETYVPVRWDGGDLEEQIAYYLDHAEERIRIVTAAHRRFREQLQQVPKRTARLLGDLVAE